MNFLKHLREELARWAQRRLDLHAEAERDLEKGEGGTWKITGREPAWEVAPPGGLMPVGWYMLGLKVVSEKAHFVVKLYPDYGDGFDEEVFFGMTVNCGRLTKRICRFPSAPRRLRLVMEGAPERIEIERLTLSRVFENFAIGCVMKRLYGDRRHPMARTAAEREQAWRAYDASHSRKVRLNYEDWLERMESWDAAAVGEEIEAFAYRPLVSVVVPVWNPPAELLRRCIESVRKQSYPNWQLCIADDASTDPAVARVLTEYAAEDSRIGVLIRSSNGHISLASNSALGLARGEYVAFLDHDDELAENALFEVVKALNGDEALDILYSDEDLIDLSGNRSSPHFKSDWNPELIRAHNYVTHLCVYRRGLIEKAGGFREGVEGAQDYDLLLRCSALTEANRIHHISKVLYHWRAHEGSTALGGAEAKGYSGPAGRKALEDYLAGEGLSAKVDYMPESELLYRVSYELSSTPLVSLMIPTRDHVRMLADCVESILKKTSYPNFEILILDNQSVEPETKAWFAEIQADSRVRVVSHDAHFNFSAINNFGLEHARGEVLGLINNDIEIITPGWLDEMVSLAMRPKAGCVGAKLYYEDSTIQHGGVILGVGGGAGHAHRGFSRGSDGYFFRLKVRQNLSAVTGACLLVRREVYEEVGGLDEELSVAMNDVDFCLRVREAGYLNVFTPFAELFHYESRSRGYEDTPEKKSRYEKEKIYLRDRWGDCLRQDPYYNPNLTLAAEDFSLNQSNHTP